MLTGLVYFGCLLFVVAWLRFRPHVSFRKLLALWWLGLFLARVAPPLASVALVRVMGSESRLAGWLVAALYAVGAMLMARGILGLSLWRRPIRRRSRFALALLVLGFVLAVGHGQGSFLIVLFLSIPWLSATRWRDDRGAGDLALASFTGLASFFLSLFNWSVDQDLHTFAKEGGHVSLAMASIGIGVTYGLATLFGGATRVHLSIRRVGRRLIVSHLLAGLVPFVVVALFLLLAGSLYLSSYRGQVVSRTLAELSQTAMQHVSSSLAASGELPAKPFPVASNAQIVFRSEAGGRTETLVGSTAFPPEALLSRPEGTAEAPLVWDRHVLYVRARIDTQASGRSVRYEVLAPLDSLDVAHIAAIVGTPVLITPSTVVRQHTGGIQIGDEEDSDSLAAAVDTLADGASAAKRTSLGAPVTGAWRLPGGAVVSCLRWRENDGAFEASGVPVLANASFAEIISALFAVASQNPLATVAVIALVVLAVLLVGAVAITTNMVAGMVRSVTRAVHALREATTAIGEGKLDHRVAVEGQDELWSVATSFNEMAAGLERVRSMELENERLEQELALAREIQNRLFPSAAPNVPEFEIAGTSRPAREVGGDYFDFLELDNGYIGITVADVSGKGAPAALLMSSFRASLRSHDLAALGPAETLTRLNRFIHGSVTTGKFITAFLGVLDPKTGDIRYACAGHEPPIVVAEDGSIGTLAEGGLALGLIPTASYEDTTSRLPRQSLMAIFTDGVTEAQNPVGEFYGDTHLLETLREERATGAKTLLDKFVQNLTDFAGGAAQFDDITMVLARRL